MDYSFILDKFVEDNAVPIVGNGREIKLMLAHVVLDGVTELVCERIVQGLPKLGIHVDVAFEIDQELAVADLVTQACAFCGPGAALVVCTVVSATLGGDGVGIEAEICEKLPMRPCHDVAACRALRRPLEWYRVEDSTPSLDGE